MDVWSGEEERADSWQWLLEGNLEKQPCETHFGIR